MLNLINTREFQRLRRIKQLGLSQFVFPGADHSRFAHSIGTVHVACRFLTRVLQLGALAGNEDHGTVVLAAALLHDVGHGPFSHAFEKVSGENHEKRTSEIIADRSTEVNQVLREYSETLPDRLNAFFDVGPNSGESAIPAFLTQIVTSQLDADRFDYLLRDSYATGSEHGRFDLEWLLQHIQVDEGRDRFYLGRKALYAAEAYVFARYHMYRTVYFHKTTRAAEVMLRLLLRRYRERLRDCSTTEARRSLVPDAPRAVVQAFSASIDPGEQLPLSDYLLLDDHSITEFAKACVRSSDEVLATLALGLLDRRLFKSTDVTETQSHRVVSFTEKAREVVESVGLSTAFAFAHDAPSDTPYKLYNPEAAQPATQIFIETEDGSQEELSRVSDSVHQLTKKYTLVRYYYPGAVRDRIRQEAEPLLDRD
ncbi:MAG: HD domain-containing protein [Planctomycetota bacterium]